MPTQKNNRILLGVLSLFIALITLTPSLAKTEAYKTYVGFDLSYTSLNHAKDDVSQFDYSDYVAGNFPGFGLYVGGRSESFGLELGFSQTAEVTKKSIALDGKTPITIKTSLQAFTLDALIFFPLDENKTFELIGALGIGNTAARTTNEKYIIDVRSAVVGSDASGFGTYSFTPRIRVGLHYEIVSQLNLRAMAEWQPAIYNDSQKIANSLYRFTLGVNTTL